MRQQEPSDANVLRTPVKVEDLHFYQKADAIYQLTYLFCQRFLPPYGDRTVDQMVQAARSGKQNIVEGIEAGRTSSETEIRLLNVARSSLQELREDYEDYLKTRGLALWTKDHKRYPAMLQYCRMHNSGAEYLSYAKRWDAEAYSNALLTLCHMTDRMLSSYLEHLEKRFIQEGGIKERMYAVRTGYRQAQDQQLAELQKERDRLQAEVTRLQAEVTAGHKEIAHLRSQIQHLEHSDER